MSEAMVLDLPVLLRQCGGNREIAVIVLDEFVSQTPADVEAIAAALASGDCTAICQAAHRLKGTAGVIGAHKFHQLCSDMELAVKNGGTAAATAAFAILKVEVQRCLDFVPIAKATMWTVYREQHAAPLGDPRTRPAR